MNLNLDTKEKRELYYNEVTTNCKQLTEYIASTQYGTNHIVLIFPSLEEVERNLSTPIPYLLTGVFNLMIPTQNDKHLFVQMAAITFDFKNPELILFDPSANQRLEVKDYIRLQLDELGAIISFLLNFSFQGYSQYDFVDYKKHNLFQIPNCQIDLDKLKDKPKFFKDYTKEEIEFIVMNFEKAVEVLNKTRKRNER